MVLTLKTGVSRLTFEICKVRRSITFEGLNGERLQTGIYLITVACQLTGSEAEIKEGDVLTWRDDQRSIHHKEAKSCSDIEIVAALRQALRED